MAFVFKAKRETTLGQLISTDLGPGQYISSESQILNKKPKSSRVPPFLTTQNRTTDLSKKEKVPGPGAYQLIQDMDVKPLPYKKNETLYNNFEIEDQLLPKPLGFLMKDQRFHHEIKEEVPGPGSYENVKKAFPQRKVKSSLNQRNIRPKTSNREPQLSVAIPSKNKCYGYDVLEDGSIKIAEDPLKFIKYDGEKLDSVGPGAYELSDKKNWNRGGTAWSKFKTKRKLIDSSEIKENKLNHSFDDKQPDSINIIEKRKLEKEKITKYLRVKSTLRRQLVDAYNNELQPEIDKIINNETPGPGYYEYGKMYSTAKEFKVPEYYQFFGSICERFNVPSQNGDNVGPGLYFRENQNYKTKKRPKSKAPFNSRSERNFLNKKDTVPGPGIYNPEKIVKNNKNSLKMIFASSTKRDTNINKCIQDNPGPGSYFEVKNELSINENKPIYKYTASFKTTKRISAFDKKDENPTVGMYNPDLVNNINYINSKKAFKPSIVNVPFSSLKKRFEEKTADTTIGPGQYFREIDLKEKIKEGNIPFKTAEKRFKSLQKQEFFVPVGTYNVTSHFDWNRKTFNINFL